MRAPPVGPEFEGVRPRPSIHDFAPAARPGASGAAHAAKQVISGGITQLRASCELVEAALEVVKAGSQGEALGLGLGGDAVEATAQRRFDLLCAPLECAERVVALAVEPAAETRESRLDALDRQRRTTCSTRSASTPSASRANRSTARSSSRPSRRAASSRAARIVVSNCCAAASAYPVASRETLRRSCSSWRCSTSPSCAATRWTASACSRSICSCKLALAEAEPVGELLERLPPLDPVLLEVGGGRRRHLLRAPRQVLAAASRSGDRCSSSAACSRSASESIRPSIWVVSCTWRCAIRAISSARLS